MYIKNFNHECKKYCLRELAEEYVQKAAQLVNSEWPRSQCQRVLSLRQYVRSDKLKIPISLILVDTESDRVVGHASLASITTADDVTKNLVFIQSVVVDPEYRGKGLGKKIMLEAELYVAEYAKMPQHGLIKTNCDFLYLNTKDKQSFYEHLGYVRIEPLLFYANKESKCNLIMKNLLQSISREKQNENRVFNSDCLVTNSPTAPLAPPPPPNNLIPQTYPNADNTQVTWFKKIII
ncbi:N-acetyltransferase 6 isoform X3 [Brachionus plicatilis]|uniref:N-acetyltransferase 6 isoform X3 n=1 Tax=Brachionus plicatilis TaxID=10195 RepID=A0A3M7R9L2_BRAPC|nr:N-acetyltransferase 6 isoform X3 [Brachionus plicatilis]